MAFQVMCLLLFAITEDGHQTWFSISSANPPEQLEPGCLTHWLFSDNFKDIDGIGPSTHAMCFLYLVEMCLLFSQMWHSLGFCLFVYFPPSSWFFNVYTINPRWPKGKVMHLIKAACLPNFVPGDYELWGSPHAPVFLAIKWNVQWRFSPIMHFVLMKCNWKKIWKSTCVLSLLFSDEGAGKLTFRGII